VAVGGEIIIIIAVKMWMKAQRGGIIYEFLFLFITASKQRQQQQRDEEERRNGFMSMKLHPTSCRPVRRGRVRQIL